jgi:hypothetical protein
MPMINVYPVPAFLVALVALTIAAWLGTTRLTTLQSTVEQQRDDFAVIQGATLTLLGLIIGFTFSMALDRYEQRKIYEEEEANAIGTEYLRAELLPAAEAAQVQQLLRDYLAQRVLFYETRDEQQLGRIDAATARLQSDLWAAIRSPALAQPTPLMALAVAGMNDVLNSQGYTQAAWWNRIPFSAWMMMGVIAVCATMLVGVGTRKGTGFSRLMLVLPVIISMAFFLIADIDSPRRGIIRVVPQNLLALAGSLQPR